MTKLNCFKSHTRRDFLLSTSGAFGALLASGCVTRGAEKQYHSSKHFDYGPLRKDYNGLLDLPKGFRYRILSRFNDTMTDGLKVPDKADGMGCIDIGNNEIVLIRNHELVPSDSSGGDLVKGFGRRRGKILAGGTTNIVLDSATLEVKRQFRSLAGTIRNCSGGVTPWQSWLSCEEAPTGPGQKFGEGLEKNHGWVFEVPGDTANLIDPIPLRAMGRFNHEAACVDEKTGFVYLTEDREDSVLYRFVPTIPGKLNEGGTLQAMAVRGRSDLRNWGDEKIEKRVLYDLHWIDLENVEAPKDDLRYRARQMGATLIARGEGIHMGNDEFYFCSTNGGSKRLGQIFRVVPGRGTSSDSIELFFESENTNQFNYGDNLCVSNHGHLFVCEDQYTEVVDNHIRGITPDGIPYDFAKLNRQTELAGACFSPSGEWLFVNAYSPALTMAITGPWKGNT